MTSADSRLLTNELLDEIIARHFDRTGDVLGILEEAQRRHPQKYLPAQTYAYVAQKTGLPPSQIMSVVTFYAFFNRHPQGRHTLTVCRGTACHTRGSRQLLEALKDYVGLHDDATTDASNGTERADSAATSFTTPDGQFTIRTVACFGQCALAPVAAIDEVIHGHVSDFSLRELIAMLDDDGKAVSTSEMDEAKQRAAKESLK